MDLLRFAICLFLFFCASLAYSVEKPFENLGVAFIHGTHDYSKGAEGVYWKQKFLNSVIQGLPNPNNYYVVHCDFSRYMWHEDAGGCVVNQLTEFINNKQITKLIVYTHSNGGNVIRWILSNPTYDTRYLNLVKHIAQVIALAPSSGGTELADEVIDGNGFEETLAWLLGYQNDAVKQQRVGDMALYNEEILLGTLGRPTLPVPFRVVIGSDVDASPFTKAAYCNGFLLNTGLKITQSYLRNCSDGFLDCASQILAGDLWFYDWQKTIRQTPLSHNQSRHNCFGLDQILRNDLLAQGVTP
ncbi:hypothetical protein [Legionella micdadei]|uniref:Lipase n=1 Tax=Legionella micdadei TaxID=451 RepID=A0A098GFU3_LEGMI|nr:hypothetical protein [Legionella micdadei]ARG97209.1 hypothetical protein B6N58_05785 [Legionella micdadei]KTD29184.1 hypothetical protein Lmic_1104 [Legionella micdadei]NSL17442.1 hypothetical protein [Legionella micdadei]CEG61338.1 conserved exported protein of unknown function [Legionella micdadei]SCY38139.1 hypothetical protein SAMN02982997_01547 [Legionella micdadei]